MTNPLLKGNYGKFLKNYHAFTVHQLWSLQNESQFNAQSQERKYCVNPIPRIRLFSEIPFWGHNCILRACSPLSSSHFGLKEMSSSIGFQTKLAHAPFFFCFRVSSFPFDGRNPANQFRLVVYPILYKVLWPSKRWLALGFLNHQSTVSSSRVPSVGTRNCHQLGLPNICAACAPLMMRRVHRSTKLTFRLARLALLAVHRFDVLLSMMFFF